MCSTSQVLLPWLVVVQQARMPNPFALLDDGSADGDEDPGTAAPITKSKPAAAAPVAKKTTPRGQSQPDKRGAYFPPPSSRGVCVRCLSRSLIFPEAFSRTLGSSSGMDPAAMGRPLPAPPPLPPPFPFLTYPPRCHPSHSL